MDVCISYQSWPNHVSLSHQGYQKRHSCVSNTQIQICRYTNTRKQNAWMTQHMLFFLKSRVQGYQKGYYHVSNIQIHKHTNTRITIQNYHWLLNCTVYLRVLFSRKTWFPPRRDGNRKYFLTAQNCQEDTSEFPVLEAKVCWRNSNVFFMWY